MIKNLKTVFQSFDWTRRKAYERCANVWDLRLLAKKRLPSGVFDYFDGAADGERTKRRNTEWFNRVQFRPRVLQGVRVPAETDVTLAEPLFGGDSRLRSPLILSPTGFTRIGHSEGELIIARSAARHQIPYTLSTLSTRSIESVARAAAEGAAAAAVGDQQAAAPPVLWWQVYVWKDRRLVLDMIARAKEAGFSALMLTVDTPVFGRRERDVRSGFLLPPKLGPATLLDGIRHPSWTWDFVRAPEIVFENIGMSQRRLQNRDGPTDGKGTDGAVSLAEYVNQQFDPSLNWSDVEWLRNHWDGPILLKGIQTVEDAVAAQRSGLVDAIALSNHGGRQLDDAPTPIELLADVCQALDKVCSESSSPPQQQARIRVLLDGGVRHGADVVKAVALGADAVMFGRPYLYALGAGGQPAVDQLLHQFKLDIGRTVALLMSGEDWQNSLKSGFIAPSPLDVKDKFLHCSMEDQVDATARLYFSDTPNLTLLTIDESLLEGHGLVLKNEPSRDGKLFPHIYNVSDNNEVPQVPISVVVNNKLHGST